MTFPKIVYPSGGANTLNFALPPRLVPLAGPKSAVRYRNVSSAGVVETILERIDHFLEFEMEWVKIGDDVAAWDAFTEAVLNGTTFDYYPDASQAAFTTYTLEDTDFTAEYKQLGMATFKMRWRKRVAWP